MVNKCQIKLKALNAVLHNITPCAKILWHACKPCRFATRNHKTAVYFNVDIITVVVTLRTESFFVVSYHIIKL